MYRTLVLSSLQAGWVKSPVPISPIPAVLKYVLKQPEEKGGRGEEIPKKSHGEILQNGFRPDDRKVDPGIFSFLTTEETRVMIRLS